MDANGVKEPLKGGIWSAKFFPHGNGIFRCCEETPKAFVA